MSGQAGLRTINNNYVASGDGRDLCIYHDQSFRGGKSGLGLTSPHLPSPATNAAKFQRPVGMTRGFNARNEGHTQHLNLSQSSYKAVTDKKTRLLGEGATFKSDMQQVHARSQPGLGDAKKPFRFVWEESARPRAIAEWSPPPLLGATGDLGALPAQELDLSDSRAADSAAWTKRMPLRSYPGYTRTPMGGFWSDMA